MDYIPDKHLRDDPEAAAAQVATHILLTRQVHRNAAWLVVEGLSDDHLFDRHIDLHGGRIACACGRKAVELVSEKLARFRKRDGFVGVVDLDFDIPRGASRVSPPVFATDWHDIETMCLATDEALDAVLSEYCDRTARREFEAGKGRSVRQALLGAARELGLMRLASLELRMGLRVSGWDHLSHYPKFLSELTVDRNGMLSFLETTPTLRHDGSSAVCTDAEINALRTELERLDGVHVACNTLHIACGHDACKILAASIGPGAVLGGGDRVWPSAIEQGLRLAYPDRLFLSTQLYAKLKGWQTSNPQWSLLRRG